MKLPKHLLPTTVVGSYPQPDWLVDRAMLSKSVPRTRMQEMWRVPVEHLEQAQGNATVVAIRDMEIKKLLLGQPIEKVINKDAMTNPACLAWYLAFAKDYAGRTA